MAKKTAALLPLSEETREVLLKLIRRSEQPQTARQLAAQLTGPFQATDKQLIPVLDDPVRREFCLRSGPASRPCGKRVSRQTTNSS